MITIGQCFANYRIVRQLGSGGMGIVFEAMQEKIDRRVAIKILHPQFSQNPQFATRFLNEARAANIVNHPGIVQVSEFGQLPDGTAYLVMELLKGESLKAHLQQMHGSLSAEEAARLARQMASALDAAHQKGIIHRDLKPDNVMLTPDQDMLGGVRIKLLDFGIAKMAIDCTSETSPTTTQSNALLGTPLYMSPEQCRGSKLVDARTDVYALGAVLYQMLSGRPPFVANEPATILVMQISELPLPLRFRNPTIPDELERLIHRLLAKDREERPSMAEVVEELDRFLCTNGAQPLTPRVQGRPWPHSWTILIVPGLVMVGLVTALIAGIFLRLRHQSSVMPRPTPGLVAHPLPSSSAPVLSVQPQNSHQPPTQELLRDDQPARLLRSTGPIQSKRKFSSKPEIKKTPVPIPSRPNSPLPDSSLKEKDPNGAKMELLD